MGADTSFQSILSEMMELSEHIEREKFVTHRPTKDTPPLWEAAIYQHIQRPETVIKKAVHLFYPATKVSQTPKKSNDKSPKPLRNEKVFEINTLSKKTQQNLITLGIDSKETHITENLIKRLYRQQIRNNHPDLVQGQGLRITAIHEAYNEVLREIKQIHNKTAA